MSAEFGELTVLGPEVVTPLTDAVGFVDRDEVDVPLLEVADHTGEHEAFGGDIE